jgi:hypothetical protein
MWQRISTWCAYESRVVAKLSSNGPKIQPDQQLGRSRNCFSARYVGEGRGFAVFYQINEGKTSILIFFATCQKRTEVFSEIAS